MDFRILGPLEVLDDGHAVALGGSKRKAVLAALLLRANEVVPSDRLIDELWVDDPPARAANALQVHISGLRKALGKERVETKAPGYVLHVAADELDLERFKQARSEGRLEDALSLWRGSPLADLAYEEFAQGTIAELEELRIACAEDRIERDVAAGRHAELIGELDGLVAEHPLRERLRAQLMLCLYRSGRQAGALDVYQAGRRLLVDQLGIEPGRELRELHTAILRQDPQLDAAMPAEPRSGVFVGRAVEVGELTRGVDDVCAGRGRLFLVEGEPGIGKSRLAEELVAHARARGADVLVGRCWEAGGAPAYWPWVQLLRSYVREAEPDALRAQLGAGAAELAQILPELRERFADLPEPVFGEPEAARFRLFDATAQFLRNVAEARPLVIVIDDLHAADTSSLLLLQFVARELGSFRALLFAAFRDVDPIPGEALTDLLRELGREPHVRRIALGGLAEDEIAEYLELTGADVASPALVTALHEETEGNPLFVGEIVRLLAIERVPLGPGGDVRLLVPASVHDVIARRIGHLPDECIRLLVLASVLGREFSPGMLARITGASDIDVIAALDDAVAARVVVVPSSAPGTMRFAHVLIRDTLYEDLTPARRMTLHRQVVDALEAVHGQQPGRHLAELAHHAIAGNDFERGARYATAAGDRALEMLAYEESARQYRVALDAVEVLPRPDDAARCRLLLSLGEAEARAGNRTAAQRTFIEAAELARRLRSGRDLARAAVGYGGRIMFARAGDDDRIVPLLEEGLAALGDEDPELRVRLLARLSGALRDEHSRARRDALSREAVELARESGSLMALCDALRGRAHAIIAPDTVAECFALSTELCEVAGRVGDAETVVAARDQRVLAALVLGEVGGIAADRAAANRIAAQLRQPAQAWQMAGSEAMFALATGRLAEAEPLIERAYQVGKDAQPDLALPMYAMQRYALGDFRGDVETAAPGVRQVAADFPARPVFKCGLALVEARLGRFVDARRVFDELVRDGCAALPFDQEWLFGMSMLAETCRLLDDGAAAGRLYELMLPWAALNAVDQAEGIRGSISRDLGLFAAAMRRWEAAADHFEVALEMNARLGARPWLARTQSDYARVLLARGRPGDQERAEALRGEAQAAFAELGMHDPTRTR